MDDEKKNIEDLAKDFEAKWSKTSLPNMEAEDLLDLMDYYTRMGMDFEADLCRYIANNRYADNPEVMLTKAHACANDGDWLRAAIIRNKAGIVGYDDALFKVEHSLRLGKVSEALALMREALPFGQKFEVDDYDFIFDTAALFFDFGYYAEVLELAALLPFDYVDYPSVLQLRVECYIFLRQFDMAKQLLNDMLDRASFDQNLWTNMACCCFEQGDYDETIEACEYALAIGDASEARHFRLMAKVRQNGGKPSVEIFQAAAGEQDYRSCMEYADTLYEQGNYANAVEAYGFANLFCARGNRDHEYILSRLIMSLIYCDAANQALPHVRALLAQQGDSWDTLYSAAELLLERGDFRNAIRLLSMAQGAHLIQCTRYNQLVALLSHYACFKEARRLWEDIFNHSAMVFESNKHLLEAAREQLAS